MRKPQQEWGPLERTYPSSTILLKMRWEMFCTVTKLGGGLSNDLIHSNIIGIEFSLWEGEREGFQHLPHQMKGHCL